MKETKSDNFLSIGEFVLAIVGDNFIFKNCNLGVSSNDHVQQTFLILFRIFIKNLFLL